MSIILDLSIRSDNHKKILKDIRNALGSVKKTSDFEYDLKQPFYMSSGALLKFKVKVKTKVRVQNKV